MISGQVHRPGLVVLHGVGNSGAIWEPLRPHLTDFTCLTPDLPGHGTMRKERWRSLEDCAKHMLDQLDEGVVHLAGVSLGAYVGLHMLRLAPNRFHSAVLSGLHPGGMKRRVPMKLMSAVMSLLIGRPGLARRNAEMMKIPAAQHPLFIRAAAEVRPSAFRRATNEVVDFALPDGLHNVAARVCIAAGGNEHGLIREGRAQIAAAFPNGTTHLAPGLGHAWPAQDPAQFATLIRDTARPGGSDPA